MTHTILKKTSLALFCVLLLAAAWIWRGAGEAECKEDAVYLVRTKENAENGVPFEVTDGAGLRTLLDADSILWYEEDGEVDLLDVPAAGSDEFYYEEYQWNLPMLGADFARGYCGQGVRVGVLDSGVNPHPDLADRLLPGHNYIENAKHPDDTTDEFGHGTKVAGLIAGSGEHGCIGAAPMAEIVPLKCTDGQSVKVSVLCSAIYGAIDDYGCNVLNLSLGVSTDYQALADAAAYAAEKNVVMVAGVGNDGSGKLYYPAQYDSVIGVGAVDRDGAWFSESNHNETVFLTAPGSEVRTTYYRGGYCLANGCSFAVPQVTAACAVLLSMDNTLTPEMIMAALQGSAIDRGSDGYDPYYGWGILNIAGAVESLAGDEEKALSCPWDMLCILRRYSDLDPYAWYHDGVQAALEQGIMNGYDDGTFRPDAATSRAMLVTMLWRAEGHPRAQHDIRYADVPNENWYADAVRWAVSVNIVNGYDASAFGPDDPVTREQLAVILYRYAQYKGQNTGTGVAALNGFDDASQVSAWAVDAMGWAVSGGLINGTGGNALSPGSNATRAQVAVILERQRRM